MPLVYCNYGVRNYGKKPITPNTRGYWEFQFTISGKNRLIALGANSREGTPGDNFWISTPDSAHGWTSSESGPSEIAVFHFSEVHESLSKLFRGRSILSTRVSPAELAEAAELAKDMTTQLYSPNYSSALQFEMCACRLSLMFLRNAESLVEKTHWSNETQVVRSSIAWYCAHLDEGVGIQETADQMGYSVSQLRKIFMKVRGIGPNKVFEECRMNRARELLQHGTMSVIDVSLECGYNNQSSFSRAFRQYHLMSPLEFKKDASLHV